MTLTKNDIQYFVERLNNVRADRLSKRWPSADYFALLGNEEGVYDMLYTVVERAYGKSGKDTWTIKLSGTSPYHYIYTEAENFEPIRHPDDY